MRGLLLLITAAGLLLGVAPSAYAVSRDACREARLHDNRIGREITNPRVLEAARDALQMSGLETRLVVCELSIPVLTATVENLGASYYVGITKVLIESFSDAELRAVLGHEIAHIVLGHRAPSFELTHSRATEYEQAADGLSAKWFGKPAMSSVLRKLRADTRRLPKASQRRQSVVELNARIKALGSSEKGI